MTRKKAFLVVQSLLCVLTALLLAGGILFLYLDGTAKQADDGSFFIFTREKAGAALLPGLLAGFLALGLAAAGLTLGIRDKNAEKPVRAERSLPDRAPHQHADRKIRILRTAVLVIALILILAGILNGGLDDVLAKGAVICTECIGLG